MGRSLFVLALVFCLSLPIAGCAGGDDDVMRVSVTIMPQKYFAERIAGDLAAVTCAVPPGMSPESYDVSPSSMAAISASVAYFKVGTLGFELNYLPAIESNNPDIKIFDTSEGIAPIVDVCGGHGEEHGAEFDPHVWSSPLAAKIMAENICKGLVEIDPENADVYKANFNVLAAEMDSVDSVVRMRLKGAEGKMFAIYHPSLKELTPLSMKNAIDTARANGVKRVFVQSEFNPDLVKEFASAINAEFVVINPLSYEWKDEILKIADAVE